MSNTFQEYLILADQKVCLDQPNSSGHIYLLLKIILLPNLNKRDMSKLLVLEQHFLAEIWVCKNPREKMGSMCK